MTEKFRINARRVVVIHTDLGSLAAISNTDVGQDSKQQEAAHENCYKQSRGHDGEHAPALLKELIGHRKDCQCEKRRR